MKNWALLLNCGIMAIFFMLSCGTSEAVMISNYYGYDSSKKQRDALNLMEKRPDWHPDRNKENQENRTRWEKENNPDGTLRFYYGESKRPINKNFSDQDAVSEAYQDADSQLLRAINNQMSYSVSDDVNEEEVINATTSRAGRTEQLNIQARTKFSSQYEAKSSAQIDNWELKGRYAETWQRVINNKAINVTHYWVVFSVSEHDIETARQRVLEQKSLEESQEERFKVRMERYDRIVSSLKQNDAQFQNEERYRTNYNDLLILRAELLQLNTLKERNDDTGNRYLSLILELDNRIEEYDPANRQRSPAGRLVSQQFIIPFPHKPDEILITRAGIYASKAMISNREYISFDSAEGANSRPRRENGLDVTAVSVNWEEAARYCNFLSNFYGLTPCYTETNRQITEYNKNNNGFRLPNRDEITAMLEVQPGFIDETEFKQISILSSDGSTTEHTIYKLSGNSGTANERLLSQSVRNTISDPSIGFRIVRNEK